MPDKTMSTWNGYEIADASAREQLKNKVDANQLTDEVVKVVNNSVESGQVADTVKQSLPYENWTFVMKDGTTVTKKVYVE